MVVVFKVGGSLLMLPDLAARLRAVLALRKDCHPLLVVGGGRVADVVRDWDRLHQMGNDEAHWLAIRAMALNEALLQTLLPEFGCVRNRQQAADFWSCGRIPILNAYDFLQDEEQGVGPELPRDWETTSDSIAAWVAMRWPAQELVLLKSAALPTSCDVAGAAERGLVDATLPQLADHVARMSWSNLAAGAISIESW